MVNVAAVATIGKTITFLKRTQLIVAKAHFIFATKGFIAVDKSSKSCYP